MKITQSWKRNAPTTDGYSLTVTYVYSSKYLHEIEEVEKELPKGMIVIDTDETKRMYPLEQEGLRSEWMYKYMNVIETIFVLSVITKIVGIPGN